MSALPVEPENDGPEKTDGEILRELHAMVSDLHRFVSDMAPAITKVGQDIQSGGLMGLIGGMMSGGARR